MALPYVEERVPSGIRADLRWDRLHRRPRCDQPGAFELGGDQVTLRVDSASRTAALR
jgi:hypothetical protein